MLEHMDQQRAFSSPSDGSEYKNTALEYISQVLMEDDMEEQPCMFYDTLALQATEKSLYDVLGDDQVIGSSVSDIVIPNYFLQGECALQFNKGVQEASKFLPKLNHLTTALENPASANELREMISSVSDTVIPNYFLESECALQFNKGVQEASMFLPKLNHLTTALENPASANELREMISKTDVRPGLEEKKNCGKVEDDELEEGSNNKQRAVSIDEDELSELFDKLLLYSSIEKQPTPHCILHQSLQGASKTSEQKEQTNGSHVGKARTRKKRDREEVIDLRTLLILCSQALSTNDLRAANEQLKQIRQHSSCFGDGKQRLAHVFADALEARMAGNGNQIYATLCSKTKSAADVLKAFQLYLLACPFQRGGIFFANRTIMEFVKEKKATTLHIIDFGILHGFHWPPLIMRFQQKIRGPLKLRITGINFPASGSHTTEVVQDTGSRLARFCKISNVPFEFNGIAQKWETIRVVDLNLRPNEVVVVNCLYRLHNLLDDTIVENNPRDAVLKLIRKINPDMFIHSIVNGSYRNPFFPPRFKNVLFHYSALFDVFESNIAQEDDEMRLILEQEIFGREVMNVVACEGTERIERPESYKQWQVRTMRAGFRQRPLDSELLSKVRGWVKEDFKNPDNFIVETDGEWMLQGWKGKILFASSVWLPA